MGQEPAEDRNTRDQLMKSRARAVYVLCFLAVACQPSTVPGAPERGYELLYEHDDQGAAVVGTKEALVSAVQAGAEVRVYWGDTSFGHLADAGFLTVFEGDVFAQMSAIESQAPTEEPKQVLFREPGVRWRAVIGTNGFFTAFMDGSEPNVRARAAKWFVRS